MVNYRIHVLHLGEKPYISMIWTDNGNKKGLLSCRTLRGLSRQIIKFNKMVGDEDSLKITTYPTVLDVEKKGKLEKYCSHSINYISKEELKREI